jgi:hypothetical protein
MTTRWDPELIPYLDWMARHLPQEMPVAPREAAERARARITGTGTVFGAASGPVVAHGGASAAPRVCTRVCGTIRPHNVGECQPAPEPDPLDEIRAVIAEPLGLGDADLPAYGQPGPGGCWQCLGPGGGKAHRLCVYCAALDQLRTPVPSRPARVREPLPWWALAGPVLFAAGVLLLLADFYLLFPW